MHFNTTELFDKQAKKLSKRYNQLKNDIESLILNFETIHQQSITIKKNLYKIRLKNSNKNRGKRSGYRVYYYIKLEEQVFLLTIYDKSEISMIDESLFIDIINDLEKKEDTNG
jgi:mRNA-degrading endonuclease RelE of RelBE toxin-antitoxin system